MQNSKKNKLRRIIAICFCYFVLSIIVWMFSGNGIMPFWYISAVLGPIWHLTVLLEVIQQPFIYLDGVVRVTDESIVFMTMSFTIWLMGLLPIVFYCMAKNKKTKRYCFIASIIVWITIACANFFLHGLYSV